MWAVCGPLLLYWSMHVGKRAVRSPTSCLEMEQCVCRAFAMHMYSTGFLVLSMSWHTNVLLNLVCGMQTRQRVVSKYASSPLSSPFLSHSTLQCGVAKGHRIPYRETSLALPRRVRGFGGRTRGGAPTSPGAGRIVAVADIQRLPKYCCTKSTYSQQRAEQLDTVVESISCLL